jgi:hypothetical protein
MRLPLLLVIAVVVGIATYNVLGIVLPTRAPQPTPIVAANQTFDVDFANWRLTGNLPAGLVASGAGIDAVNTWAVIDRASVIEKSYYDEGLDYVWPSSYCETDQQIAYKNELAAQYDGEPVPAADPWLGCAVISIGDDERGYEQVELAIYRAGSTRLNVLGEAVPATCAATPAGATMTTTIYGETGEGPDFVVSQEIEVPLSPFESRLFGLPAYGYSVEVQTDLFAATRFLELCAQKGDRILVLMTSALGWDEEGNDLTPYDEEGNELPLPVERLLTVYGAPVWPALANGSPALVNK